MYSLQQFCQQDGEERASQGMRTTCMKALVQEMAHLSRIADEILSAQLNLHNFKAELCLV